MTSTLPSWSETPTKQAILDFVAAVTDESGPDHIPPAERIAAFDNDGTLWCEKPLYAQFLFSIDRLKEMAEAEPRLLDDPAYEAAATGDMAYFAKLDPHAGGDINTLFKLVFDTHAGMTEAEFQRQARTFLKTTKHPRFAVPLIRCTYQPMVELMDYLRVHDFKVFIESAGGLSFMRSVSEEIYGVPMERVIGTAISYETKMTSDGPVVHRKRGITESINDGPGKPVNIQLHIGRPPVLAAGNSDGDLHMLWMAEKSGHQSLSLLVHHDDVEREYAYDTGSEKTLKLAGQRGWTVISMKDDWRTVFAFANHE